MKVLIVGGGIGGLTLAAFLEHSEIEYDVVEKCTDWSRQGFLLGLWDNGRDILEKLGLAEKLDTEGSRVRTFSMRDGEGRILRNYNLTDVYTTYGSGITLLRRDALHQWLLEKMDQTKIKMGTTIEEMLQDTEKVTVTLSDGTTGVYDAVIGADGVHSSVRTIEFPGAGEIYENWRIWYTWIDNSFDVPATVVEYLEPREFAIVYHASGRTMAWLMAPADHVLRDSPKGRLNRLVELFKEEKALMPDALKTLRDEDIQVTDLLRIKLRRWVRGRAVLLGDAAHSFGPHAGIGGAMAMEDAYVLASELMRVNSTYLLSHALQSYEKKRKRRVAIAERISNRLRLWTLVKSKPVRKLFDLCVPFIPERYLMTGYHRLFQNEL